MEKSNSIIYGICFLLFHFLFSSASIMAHAGSVKGDSEKFRVLYQFRQQALKNDMPFFVTDTMALEVDQDNSVYYDFLQAKRDSIKNIRFMRMRSISFSSDHEELGQMLELKGQADNIISDREGETARIFKDRSSQEIITVDKDADRIYKFVVKETVSFDWEISSDTLTILNYVCMKATTRFRGRTYEAWFTTDIPVNEGPWKFYGLPGMILKVEDTENVFSFKAIGLEKIEDLSIPNELIPASRRTNLTYHQLNDLKKQRIKKISYGFYENSSSIKYYGDVKNPATYPDIERE